LIDCSVGVVGLLGLVGLVSFVGLVYFIGLGGFVGQVGFIGLVGTHSESVVCVGGCFLNVLHFLTSEII
jgi:hypothetical protein